MPNSIKHLLKNIKYLKIHLNFTLARMIFTKQNYYILAV